MSKDLQLKTGSAVFWSVLERVGLQSTQFLVSIILARILLPEQFGMLALLNVFLLAANLLIDSGFASALIQKQSVSYADECSIFYLNVLMGVLSCAGLCLLAPWIAAFYKMPLLTDLTRALSFNLIISSFGVVQVAGFSRRMDFKSLAKASFIGTLSSGGLGTFLALSGFGVWSLVAQAIANQLVNTILLWVYSPWRPAWLFCASSLKSMFRFGSRLLFSSLLEVVFSNLYVVIFGKLFSPTAVGYYSRAEQVPKMLGSTLSLVSGRIALPLFSSMQSDPKSLKAGMQKALSILAFINFPLMVGLAVIARPFVLTVLTEKWAPCIPYLQFLCVAGMLYPMHAINLNVLLAQGRSDLYFRIEVWKKTMAIVFLLATFPWGMTAMVIGQVICSVLSYYLNTFYTGKLLDYSMVEQLLDMSPYFGCSVLMGVIVHALNFFPDFSMNLMLILQVFVGVGVYCVACLRLKTSGGSAVSGLIRSVAKRAAFSLK
ncbi:MAG: lipopolysaccharide biosynthesis protein [Verrucomicrobiota bacterium]